MRSAPPANPYKSTRHRSGPLLSTPLGVHRRTGKGPRPSGTPRKTGRPGLFSGPIDGDRRRWSRGESESVGVSPLRRSSILIRNPLRCGQPAGTWRPVAERRRLGPPDVRGRTDRRPSNRTRRRVATGCASTATDRIDPDGATIRERAEPRCRARRIHHAAPRTSLPSPMRGTSAAILGRAAETRSALSRPSVRARAARTDVAIDWKTLARVDWVSCISSAMGYAPPGYAQAPPTGVAGQPSPNPCWRSTISPHGPGPTGHRSPA